MDDLISRQAVLQICREKIWNGADYYEPISSRGIAERVKAMPSVQPNLQPACNNLATDTISRQAAIDAVFKDDRNTTIKQRLEALPSAQPEIIRCKDCIYHDPPHVENNGVRYEYDEMPADAFDALGTGLVNAEYGINIGGRCCVDYYCKNYSDDKRVFVREDNYCGRAERRTDDSISD